MTPQRGLAYAVTDVYGLNAEGVIYTVTDGSDDPGADPEIDGILFGPWNAAGESVGLLFGGWSAVADVYEPKEATWSG